MPYKTANLLFMITVLLLLPAGCASKRPVIYPNAYYKSVGKAVAENDINDCIALAGNSGVSATNVDDVVTNTAGGAAVGSVAGAAAGAVYGHSGRGAAAGAAGGAAGGLTRGLIRSSQPDPVFRNFVTKCLRDKGYEPIGWR